MRGKHTLFLLTLLGASGGCNQATDFAGTPGYQPEPQLLADKEFAAAAIGEAELTVNPRFGTAQEVLSLTEGPLVASSRRQAERPIAVEEYRQGHDGDRVDMEFDATKDGPLDLLIVVDNSKSMKTEQENLAARFGAFTKPLGTTDWAINVVTTDDSCMRTGAAPIRRGDADAKTRFETAINAGISGSGTEKGIKQALRSLKGECSTGDMKWLREGTSLGILFLSDENSDCATSFGKCRDGEGPDHLNEYLQGLLDDGKAVSVKAYGLLWDEDDPQCEEDTGDEEEAPRYQKVIDNFGGFSESVCAPNYTAALKKIAMDVGRVVRREYEIDHDPDADTLVITADGTPVEDFEVNGRMLKVTDLPLGVKKLEISYRYGATPKYDRFLVSEAPAVDTLRVFIEGNEVDPAEFSYDPVAGEVTLQSMPPDNAEILFKYRKDAGLPSLFDFEGDVIGQPSTVAVSGVLRDDWTYDEMTGVLRFDTPPEDGSEIRVAYKDPALKVLRYPMTHVPDPDLEAMTVHDSITGEPVDHTIEEGAVARELVLQPQDVVEGRELLVTYSYGDGLEKPEVTLAHEPLPDSLAVRITGGEAGCESDYAYENGVLSFGCEEQVLGRASVSYSYVAALYDRFRMEGDFPADAEWTVTVDGEPVPFVREGNEIVVEVGLLGPDSKVRIRVIGVPESARLAE